MLLDTASTDNSSPSISTGCMSINILLSSSFTGSGFDIESNVGASLIFSTIKAKDTGSESTCPSLAITDIEVEPS